MSSKNFCKDTFISLKNLKILSVNISLKTQFQARDNDEREKWVRRLEDTIRRHAKGGRIFDSFTSSYLSSGFGNQNAAKKGNHLELLDKKISEADAYLQLMIEQTNVSSIFF